MSIIGIGIDQTELARIRSALERFGPRFLDRCYTPIEQQYCARFRDPVPHLAARYAAKEAGAKALGTGLAHGICWREIEVRREEGHRPENLHLHGRALEYAAQLGAKQIHLSLTHARELAAAFVIIEN